MLRSFRKPSLKPRKRLLRKRMYKYGQIRRLDLRRPVVKPKKEIVVLPNKEEERPRPSPLDRPLLFRYMQNHDLKEEEKDKESEDDS